VLELPRALPSSSFAQVVFGKNESGKRSDRFDATAVSLLHARYIVMPTTIPSDVRSERLTLDPHSRQWTDVLNAIIDSSYDGLWICDREGKVVRINRASERINGIQSAQVVGKRMQQLIRAGMIDKSVTLEVFKRKTAVTIVQRLDNGKEILVTGNPVFDNRGEIGLVVVNERDISELNKLRAELEKSRAMVEKYHAQIAELRDEAMPLETAIRSEPMSRVLNTAQRVAGVDSTVLLNGESGVGKGFLAKLIHRSSQRKGGPFVRIDCGSVPEPLMESELFGYEPGAFTGASSRGKRGRLELGEGGTVFLDEVGDLSSNIQVKLLRFLEENEIFRVGGVSPKRIDARVIAATNRDLEEMVRRGVFREDLFFRLNVVPIHIPPLRERPEDIPPLIQLFVNRFNEKFSAQKRISPRVTECLCGYSFPGNVRELANLLERLIVLTPNDIIDVEDLPVQVRFADHDVCGGPLDPQWTMAKVVAAVEKKLIARALKIHGSQRKAAGPLGVNQSTLARKIRKYDIRCDANPHNDA
jgi:PAS domain S-box-containing protein